MSFQLATTPGDDLPRIVERPITVGSYDELPGAVLVVTSGKYVGGGTGVVANIAGVAVGAGGADTSGFNVTGRKEFPSGVVQAVWPGPGVIFSCEYTGSVPANVGGEYGLVKDTDNKYKVAFADTANKAVAYVGALNTSAPESQKRVLVTFKQSVVVAN